MKSEFTTCTLKDIASKEKGSIISGPFGSNISSRFFQEFGVPVIRGNNLSKGSEKFIDDGFAFLTQEKADELNAYAVENDLIFTAAGTIGQVGILEKNTKYKNYVISNKQIRVRLDVNKVNPLYAYYWFSSPWVVKDIMNKNTGSTVPLINLGIIRTLEIKIPKKETQNKIASILKSLDSKIELNNRINAELEAMAKTLYDYWFVQFDFPNAKGKPYKTIGGKMVWNEELKRVVPAGWGVGELKDIANITMGQSPPGESYNEDGEGSIFFQGCTDFGNRFPTVRKFTTQPTRFAKAGDILLSVRAPVGTLNIANDNCCIGRGLASLNSKDNCITYLFGVMINLKQIFDRRNVDGTTFGSITKDDLFSLKVVRPTKDILQRFHEIINPAFEKQNKIELENFQLAELRDWLLPMLMNGQVKVGDMKKEESLAMAAEPDVKYGKRKK
jgi:type I restriction enzyme S subunit